MLKSIRRVVAGLRGLNSSLKQSTHVYMVIVAAVIGALAGYGAVGFRLLIRALQSGFWGAGEFSLEAVEGLPWYWVVLAPTVGGLIVGFVVWKFAPEAKGHGVPEVMEAVVLQNGQIRPRVVGVKALASGVCIASGGSVGREGPIVQIGAAIGSTAGQFLGVRPRRLRTFVGCGAAAGIAATFNAPVAGALFAVEVLLGDFGVPQFSPIVISSVVATVVSHAYLGDFPAFEVPAYALRNPLELVGYVVLGIAACFVAIAFIRSLYYMEDRFDRVRLPQPLKAAFGGMVVGGIALLFPGVLGVGYEQINLALQGSPGITLLLAVLVAKLLAVGMTIGSGGSGGIFAPSLFIGAMLGGAVGNLMNFGFPGEVAAPGAYALVGMGAVVAATTHAPITAIVIIFELTSDYRIILPLMISSIIATLMITRLLPDSIYTMKLARRGIRIRRGQDVNLLRGVAVRDVIGSGAPVLEPGTPLPAILERLSLGEASSFYVPGEDGTLLGVLSLNELKPLLKDAEILKDLVVAEDIAVKDCPSVQVTDTLDKVLERLDAGYRDELPVLDGDQFVGVVRIEDVLNRYRQELFRHEMAGTVAASMAGSGDATVVQRVGAHAVAEVEAPPAFYGRNLKQIDLRRTYGLNILLVKSHTAAVDPEPPKAPGPEDVIQPGDVLVVFGDLAGIAKLEGA